MKQFNKDINHWENYDFVVINDQLDRCYEEIIQLINKRKEKSDYSYDKKNIKNHILKLRR
jgi:guanylate kinase